MQHFKVAEINESFVDLMSHPLELPNHVEANDDLSTVISDFSYKDEVASNSEKSM